LPIRCSCLHRRGPIVARTSRKASHSPEKVSDRVSDKGTTDACEGKRRELHHARWAYSETVSKLDMPESMIRQFRHALERSGMRLRTHHPALSADLKLRSSPASWGNPDCAACGCIVSMGLKARRGAQAWRVIPVGAIFRASLKIGQLRASAPRSASQAI